MSASLVGSEMCIRDRRQHGRHDADGQRAGGRHSEPLHEAMLLQLQPHADAEADPPRGAAGLRRLGSARI
eukprot:14377035-Alexandrium_andersonii.AAC.1